MTSRTSSRAAQCAAVFRSFGPSFKGSASMEQFTVNRWPYFQWPCMWVMTSMQEIGDRTIEYQFEIIMTSMFPTWLDFLDGKCLKCHCSQSSEHLEYVHMCHVKHCARPSKGCVTHCRKTPIHTATTEDGYLGHLACVGGGCPVTNLTLIGEVLDSPINGKCESVMTKRRS